ncbi:MAG: hypothetical protein ACI9U2_002288 [Bradymonadia bacterium]
MLRELLALERLVLLRRSILDHSKILTGADDWRSDSEKQKSELRKAAISMLKLWIPDHPEASMAKDEFYAQWREAMVGLQEVTFVSMLSLGVEDLMVHNFGAKPLSLQTLLVQSAGTEAFLDARNALRVVRRKFGMMTLISRMAGIFEQRNLHALIFSADISEAELLRVSLLMANRPEGTSAEEEQRFKSSWRRAELRGVRTLYHADVIGRRLPLGWPVKAHYTALSMRMKAGQSAAAANAELIEARIGRLAPKDFGTIAQYANRLCEDLEAPDGFDPADALIAAAPERPMLGVTRRLYDDFRLLRRERSRARHDDPLLGSMESSIETSPDASIDDDLLAEATEHEDDELRRLALALERIRRVRGPEFFTTVTARGEEIDFDSLEGSMESAARVEDLNPLEAFAQARMVAAPYYQTLALAGVVPRLIAEGQESSASDAAQLCLDAAHQCEADDRVEALTLALGALLATPQHGAAADAIVEALAVAHQQTPSEHRAEALMRVASALFESGPLPSVARARLSGAFLGEDVHFWGKPEVTPALVEICLALLSARDDDTIIFLQKVVAHADEEVRRSVLRAMPVGEDVALRTVLLTHLKDPSTDVRCEVIERIGVSGELTFFIYLINHLRHSDVLVLVEARALALNLCRLESTRAVPYLNGMLGKLAHPDKRLLKRQAPIKHADESMQLAAIEALYRLNSRPARQILHHLTQKKIRGGGLIADTIQRVWLMVKSAPYGDALLPRSPHHPEWSEDDDAVDFLAELDAAQPEPSAELPTADEAPSVPDEAKKGGFFGRIRTLLARGDDAEDAGETTPVEPAGADSTASSGAAAQMPVEAATEEEAPRARAALEFEGVLLEGPELWSGRVQMRFALYPEEDAAKAIWTEELADVAVRGGTFSVHLGVSEPLPEIPKMAWLGMAVDGGGELAPRTRLGRARTIVQG